MIRLSVNLNKVALLRNSRGGDVPDVIRMAVDCERFGADGITVHPRPDERHIRYADVHALKAVVTTELNVEGFPSERFLQLVEAVKPDQVTLVPDPPEALTSDHGWDTRRQADFLRGVIQRLKALPTRVSVFIDPVPEMAEAAAALGADRVELFTGPYAHQYEKEPAQALAPYVETAKAALNAGLGINAGHDLNLDNLQYLAEHLPGLAEVSIGHALIADALYFGMENVIQMYLYKIRKADESDD